VQTLEIDETQTILASGFQSGKFQVHSSDDSVLRILRYDDDGQIVSDAFQTLAQFRWDDASGGSLGVNRIQGNGAVEVAFGDTILAEQGIKSDTWRPNNNPGLTVEGNLHVTGNITFDGTIPSPFHVAGRFNGIVGATTILSSKGRHAFTFQRLSQGFYKITFPAHPDGANFIVLAQGEGTGGTWNILHDANNSADLANSPTSVTFIVRNNTFALTDGIVNFTILA